jgi:DNA polymerase III gamma/tau subunit
MRDALSLADQLLSLVGTKPTLADAKALSVDSGGELVDRVLDAVLARDRAGVLNALRQMSAEAQSITQRQDSILATIRPLVVPFVA